MIDQPHWRRLLLRSEETADFYEQEIKKHHRTDGEKKVCNLCADTEAVIEEFEHWVLMKNRFPYDRYFSKSDMLATKRHTDEAGLNEEEKAELLKLKGSDELAGRYDSMLEHFQLQRSLPGHYHVHVIQYKRHDGEPR